MASGAEESDFGKVEAHDHAAWDRPFDTAEAQLCEQLLPPDECVRTSSL
jgi:hypothetical protein